MEQQNIILEGIHYRTRKVIRMGIRNGMIFSLTETDRSFGQSVEQGPLPVIAPGLVELQINGYRGVDFNDPRLTTEEVITTAEALLELGITRFYPTLITGPRTRIVKLINTIIWATRLDERTAQLVGGIHLEGPFISREEGPRGAHPKRYCLEPDISLLEEFQVEAEGKIRLLTMAPELPGSEGFIKACRELGMVVAIGHTSAGSREIQLAVEAGATLSTHLGNGSHQMLPRHPNYIWDQLAHDGLFASMVADGFHLPDAVLKVFIRSKGDRSILVSDGMNLTGMEPGVYESRSTGKVRLTPEGKLHREGKPELLAGSASTLQDGIRKIASMEGFATAWDMASLHPARLMSLSSRQGLQVGAPADLVLLDRDTAQFKITRVYKNGIPVQPHSTHA